MRRVRINVGRVGLVFKNADYQRVLEAGTYWLGWGETIMIYDKSKPFHSAIDLNIVLNYSDLAEKLIVVEVRDNAIAIQYENDLFKNVLTPGRYAFWKGIVDYSFQQIDLSKVRITEDLDTSLLSRQGVLPYTRCYEVYTYERGLLFIDGKYSQELGPGLYHYWKNNTSVVVKKVDVRMLQQEVSGQEVLTQDKASLRINFQTVYKVVDIETALLKNSDFERQLYVSTQLGLREIVGALTLDQLLDSKELVNEYVSNRLKTVAKDLGVSIQSVGVKDIILPGEVREIMNQVLVAQKKAQANVITRREETASTRSLLNTAKLMEDNEMLFKLKEMEYVEKIAEKIGEITVSGNGQVIDQLRGIFSTH